MDLPTDRLYYERFHDFREGGGLEERKKGLQDSVKVFKGNNRALEFS